MCIRDSPRGVDDIAVLLDALPHRVRGDQEHPVGSREGFIAVSYTHLRAHETVLDLVCRLLLEKKKQRLSKAHLL